MTCEMALKVQAYMDGELDALEAAAVEAHLENCADCQAQCETQGDLKALFAQADYYRASPQLRVRLASALDGATPRRRVSSFWLGLSSGAGGMALAACVALLVFLQPSTGLVDELVAAHTRALDDGKLFVVASSDHHTVKPWFAGHADVSPPVADFAAQGFTLVGGRSDAIAGQRAAVTLYRHGLHVVALFAWADNGHALPADASRKGYHAFFWKDGDIDLAAVSDTASGELRAFEALVKKSAAAE